PLHAFDLDRIAGRSLTIRRAADGERVQTLDGQTRRLDDRMLLIADAEGPTSIAGVMGGARSEVSEDTTRVLMEVATWDGPTIPRRRCAEILRSLEFATAETDDGLDVQPPYFRRNDITREADVIEEVARLDGLEKLPSTLPSRHGAYGRLTPRQLLRRRAADLL